MSQKVPFEKLVDYVRNRLPQDELIEIGQVIQKDIELQDTVQGIRSYFEAGKTEADINEMSLRVSARLDDILKKNKNRSSKGKNTKCIIIISILVMLIAILIYYFY